MDINKVSRALFSLNFLYGEYFRLQGCITAISKCGNESWRKLIPTLKREALKIKTEALIEHDRWMEDRVNSSETEVVALKK